MPLEYLSMHENRRPQDVPLKLELLIMHRLLKCALEVAFTYHV
jgi:hypothetical protein